MIEQFERYPGARVGSGYILLFCPYHDNTVTPALAVYDSTERFVCYSCGAKGTANALLGALELEPVSHVPPPPTASGSYKHRPRWTTPLDEYATERAEALGSAAAQSAGAISYLESRGISAVADMYGLGYDNGWIIFPCMDRFGGVQGMVARALPHRERQTGMRYDLPSEQKPMMYVPDWRSIEDATELYITFGVVDAISLAMVGMAAVSATAGKRSFNPDWLAHHNRSIYIVPDRDEESTAYDLAARLDWRSRVLRLRYGNNCKDPNDLLVAVGKEGLRDEIDRAKLG